MSEQTSLQSEDGEPDWQKARRLDTPTLVKATPEDRLAFAECEELVYCLFRIGETEPSRPDRFAYFTEDTQLILHHSLYPDNPTVVSGRANVEQRFREGSAELQASRLHVCSNFIWRSLDNGEVEGRNVMMHYEFPVVDGKHPVDNRSPNMIADCTNRFRKEDETWKLSYRYYWILYSAEIHQTTPSDK